MIQSRLDKLETTHKTKNSNRNTEVHWIDMFLKAEDLILHVVDTIPTPTPEGA